MAMGGSPYSWLLDHINAPYDTHLISSPAIRQKERRTSDSCGLLHYVYICVLKSISNNRLNSEEQLNRYEIRILFKLICQFVWLFPCFVRVANPFVNLKLHLCYITLRIYRNQNKNNFTFSVQFTNLTKRGNEHRRALEILKKIWICLAFI